MCVILALETDEELSSLTLDQLKNAEAMNPDGNGYATLINGKVVFEKGITIESIWEKIQSKEILSPCIIHCRITSVGETIPELCHPFIVNKDSRNYMNGTIKDSETAFFHNGTFSEYKDLVLQTAMGSGRKLPSGKMSDSRGIAFVLQTLGNSALEFIDSGFNKFATLNAKEGLKKYGSWVNVNGIQSSNNYYDSISKQYGNFPRNSYFGYDELNDEDTIFYSREKSDEIENDISEPCYDMDKAQTAITEFKGKPLESFENSKESKPLKSKVTKKEHKMNKRFLKEHGWTSFEHYTKQELRAIVNSMQKQNNIIDKIKKAKEKLKKCKNDYGLNDENSRNNFENSYDVDDYEDVRNYQKFNHKTSMY